MMTEQPPAPTPQSDVPGQIFDQFLRALADSKMPALVVERLRALLHSEKAFTEKAVTDALFAEEQLP